jgi:hypothetical protein
LKKQGQIEKERAILQFRRMATETESNLAIHLMLPLAGIGERLAQGAGCLLSEAGLALMRLVMEDEGRQSARRRVSSALRHPAWGLVTSFLRFLAGLNWPCRSKTSELQGEWVWRPPDVAVWVHLVSGIEHCLAVSRDLLGLAETMDGLSKPMPEWRCSLLYRWKDC